MSELRNKLRNASLHEVVKETIKAIEAVSDEIYETGELSAKAGEDLEDVKYIYGLYAYLMHDNQFVPNKPILCIDFDGVIHSYISGWKGAAIIPDPPVKGAIEWIAQSLNHFTVVINSSRANSIAGIESMQAWLVKQGLPPMVMREIKFAGKPPAHAIIDDRAIRFFGDWSSVDPGFIKRFQSWVHQARKLGKTGF